VKGLIRFIALTSSILLYALTSTAQDDPNLEQGLKAYGSYHGGSIDTVSLTNGNLFVQIPLFSYPQRGKLNLDYVILYNNKGWGVKSNHNQFGPTLQWDFRNISTVRIVKTGALASTKKTFCRSSDPDCNTPLYTVTAGSWDGSTHQMGSTSATSYESLDGTGIRWDSNASTTTAPSGVRQTDGGASDPYEDANGNQMFFSTSSGFADTLGRPWPAGTGLQTDVTGCPAGAVSSLTWIFTGPGGASLPVKICYATYSYQTAFGVSSILEASGTTNLASAIVLPTTPATSYLFNYNAYLDLTSITLPTGGSITYDWQTITLCATSSAEGRSRAVHTRTVNPNDGTPASVWTYSFGPIDSNLNMTNIVTDPLGNDTVHVVTGLAQACSFYETKTQAYQGSSSSGTLLKTVVTEYATAMISPYITEGAPDTSINVLPTRITTIWPDGNVSRTVKQYDQGATAYDENSGPSSTFPLIYGSVIQEDTYDFGLNTPGVVDPNQVTPGPLVRRTVSAYKWQQDANYKALNLLSLPASVVIQDGTQNRRAETDYQYDEFALVPSGVTTQHNSTPINGNFRGNVTSVSRWLDTTNTLLTTTNTYFDTGMLATTTDPGLHPTHFFYNCGFSSSQCFVGAYLTQTKNAKNQTTDFDYDFSTGLPTATRDANSQVTTSDYESMWRIFHHHTPDGGAVTWNYTDAQPPKFTVSKAITSALNYTVEADLDGIARLTKSQILNDPEGVDTKDIAYDPLGRAATASNLHRSAGSSTDGASTTKFDAMGRPTMLVPPDGTLINSGQDCANCVKSSFGSNVSVVVDQAGKQRRSYSDALGRIIEVDEPNSSAVGTGATASVAISGAFNSTWVGAGTPHLAATGTAIASVTMSDGSSHDFYFDINQHLCQMTWFSGSGWYDQDLTSMTEAGLPLTGSAVAAAVLNGVIHVFYQGANLHIYDMNWTGSVWQNVDMTALTGASAMSGTKMSTVLTGNPNSPMMFYEGTNQHLFTVYWNSSANAWQNADLNALSGATTLMAVKASFGSVMFSGNGGVYVFYIGTNQHLIDINWDGSSRWLTGDLTIASGGAALAVSGSAVTTVATGTSIDLMSFYEGTNQHIYSIYWNGGAGAWQTLDFTAFSGATNVAAVQTALTNQIGPSIFYFGSNQHLDDIYWNGSAYVNADLTSLANTTVVAASGSSLSSHGTAGPYTYNLFFEGGNQHIYRTYYNPSAPGWFNEDPLVTASNFVVDSGTVSLTIPNGSSNFTATVCYGVSTNPICAGQPVNASPGDIANALAAVLNGAGSPVTAAVNGTTINMTWRTAGPATASVAAMSSSSDNPNLFPSSSFTSTAANFSTAPPPPFDSTSYITLYQYDALDRLTCVEQHGNTTGTGCSASPASDVSSPWRVRRFTYDSLSRLVKSSVPESGNATTRVDTTYTYDADGNLLTKTFAAPNQTGTSTVTMSYCYEELHRTISKAYTNQSCPMASPVATYSYDQASFNGLTILNGIGRRTSMTDQGGSEAWSYDPVGRPKIDQRVTNGVTKTTTYAYNLDGSVSSLTYPSGSTITYTYSGASRTLTAVDIPNSINYAAAALYAPPGLISSLKSGANLTSTSYYNRRLQPCRISITTNPAAPLNCSDNSQIGNILDFTYGFNFGLSNNGNVIQITNNRDTTRNQTFSYDPLNRIAMAQTNSTTGTKCWGETFGYDAWSNLLTIGGLTGYSACTQENLAVTATLKNQVAANTYDSAGNLINITSPSASYTYDAENHLTATAGVAYTYDGDGRRVQKSTGTLYWYGMGSDALDETDLSGSITNGTFSEYVFFNGKRIARRNSSNTVFYNFADHLGTSRVIVQAGQTSPCYDADFFPFGGEKTVVNTCPPTRKFTDKERDTESGLDYFGARYYSSSAGRFVSVDSGAYVLQDPETLNRYAYTRNNPLKYIDPSGKYFVVAFDMRVAAQQWISTMLRSAEGRELVHRIAADPHPTFVSSGKLTPPHVNANGGWNITSGQTSINYQGITHAVSSGVASTQVTLDIGNAALAGVQTHMSFFHSILKAFAHEITHVDDINKHSDTLQNAAAAGAAGDAPSTVGGTDTNGGTAEANAVKILGQVGAAADNIVPDSRTDAEAQAIIDAGIQQMTQEIEGMFSDILALSPLSGGRGHIR
jgi:RHS repeat-associated protein